MTELSCTKIVVNGDPREVKFALDTPLLLGLRDLAKRTGTKYGFEMGSCGAWTIYLNGEAGRVCQKRLTKMPFRLNEATI